MTYTSDFETLTVEPEATAPIARIGLDQVQSAFYAESIKSGLSFGKDHASLTAQFIAALATKPFVILSGLSGSGKTALATTFGEWLGHDQVLLQPVRPDWTSPQALLGYEDRGSESYNSQYQWSVPRVLDFILTAAHDPTRPYLLILDEMNLAHVEQYFADVLSGMESNHPIVPNLQRDASGWRMPPRENQYILWPRNLFTVGTINVDETTYAFSPKVLDRAGVIEFRVTPDSIRLDYPKRDIVQRGDTRVVRAFLDRALGDEANWTGRKPIGSALQTLHQVLYNYGAEFGHRVVRESLRFSSMMYETGVTDIPTILDLIVMQRIMPKLELPTALNPNLIDELAGIAAFGPNNTSPVDPLSAEGVTPLLPKTMAKLRRLAAQNLA